MNSYWIIDANGTHWGLVDAVNGPCAIEIVLATVFKHLDRDARDAVRRDLRAEPIMPEREEPADVEEPFTDAERQLLVVLVTKAWVEIRGDAEMASEAAELEGVLRKLSGVDTVLVARRAYPSGAGGKR